MMYLVRHKFKSKHSAVVRWIDNTLNFGLDFLEQQRWCSDTDLRLALSPISHILGQTRVFACANQQWGCGLHGFLRLIVYIAFEYFVIHLAFLDDGKYLFGMLDCG